MKRAILWAAYLLVLQQTKGQVLLPKATVTCNGNHTVDILITNVDDAAEWGANEWSTKSGVAACQPTIDAGAQKVTYDNLNLPDCALDSDQNTSIIHYVLKISAKKTVAGYAATSQLRTYDHLYYVSCSYDNTGRASANFVPIKNRADNATAAGAFTFYLMAYSDAEHKTPIPNPVDLDVEVFFKAKVTTQSNAPNLDLYPVSCYSSKSSDAAATDDKFILITSGCGSYNVSEDLGDTLSYGCAANSTTETFSLKTYRYFGANARDTVYIHCDFRVCLADEAKTACECPDSADSCVGDPSTDVSSRYRRSISDSVDESHLYHVVSGPFSFKQEELNENEVASDDQEETSQSLQTVAIIGAVCGVVAVTVICATVYLVIRYLNMRTQNGDLHVVS